MLQGARNAILSANGDLDNPLKVLPLLKEMGLNVAPGGMQPVVQASPMIQVDVHTTGKLAWPHGMSSYPVKWLLEVPVMFSELPAISDELCEIPPILSWICKRYLRVKLRACGVHCNNFP